ncbi:restriction endonuclease subunit S [Listeria seeligeri]|uniref:restriction endonuclease subunit S n=1 Tax=Listeria seeligeri TaxID=1640 RepID=UPI0022EA8EDC|nr:restriction endonuclease subunit S [Listeria seeligeri]
MSDSKKKVPKRRFEEFSNANDWELRKLMSVFEFPVSTNSLSRSQLNYDNGEIKSVHYGDILVNYDSILEIAKDRIPFITNGVIDKYKPNLLENGDLIFADAAEDETVGKAVEVDGKTNEYIVAGLHTIVARPRRKMAKFFWGYYINSSIYHNQLLRLMQGTKVASISKSNLQKTYVTYPDNFVEQKKIGTFFKQLDDTIALHQRKLEKIKALKTAYLSELFPAEGESKPKRRFAGFTDAWEQRKLGEVTESFDGKRVPIDSGLRVLGEYPYYGATGIIDYVDDYIFDGEYVLLAEDGANIIMRNNPVAYLTQGKFWLNNHAHIMRMIEGNNCFLVQVLEKIDYIKYNTGTAQPKLNSKIVKNIEFKLPQIEEQQQIGAFFKQLDDTITLHQRKLQKLQNIKKAYLNEMFI